MLALFHIMEEVMQSPFGVQIRPPAAPPQQSQLFLVLGNEEMSASQRDATVRQWLDLDRRSMLRDFVDLSNDQISLLVDHIFRNRQVFRGGGSSFSSSILTN